MTEFLFALHPGATSQQESMVLDGLEAHFPGVRFMAFAAGEALENAVIPLVGTPHPTDVDAIVVNMPAEKLMADVRAVFRDLLKEARAARPS
jgi:hypothetical protein